MILIGQCRFLRTHTGTQREICGDGCRGGHGPVRPIWRRLETEGIFYRIWNQSLKSNAPPAPLLLLLLLAAVRGIGAQDAALRFIDDFSGMAKCLDGSPMGMYVNVNNAHTLPSINPLYPCISKSNQSSPRPQPTTTARRWGAPVRPSG